MPKWHLYLSDRISDRMCNMAPWSTNANGVLARKGVSGGRADVAKKRSRTRFID
jgi:hypothetical protein